MLQNILTKLPSECKIDIEHSKGDSMNDIYKINKNIDVPIYQQLVDIIESAIKKGDMAYGERLPTVQEMIDRLGIARGTVKRAYDELELKGLIDKSQGRGTFVSFQPSGSGSRKEQAIAAIDKLFFELEEMGFSAAEINIFINLKLREWAEQETLIKIAIVECNHEILSNMSDQLRHIPGVDPYAYTLETIKQYPYKLGENFDLVITTPTHAKYLEGILPSAKKPVQVALRPAAHFLSSIIRLSNGKRLGSVVYSERFGSLIYNTCRAYTEDVYLAEPLTVSSSEKSVEEYLSALDVVIVPKHYEKLFPSSVTEVVRLFKGDVIETYYELDEGSTLYLERKIKKLFKEKNI